MFTHTYTRIHTRKFDVLQTRLIYSFKKKKPNFFRDQPDEGLGLVYDVRVTHTHTHTHTHTVCVCRGRTLLFRVSGLGQDV